MDFSIKKPTIRDIALQADVSIATVSRVLNSNGSVKPELEKRIRQAIKDLDYIPNDVAKNLKTRSGRFISFIMSDISNNYFTAMADTIQKITSQKGYTLIIFNSDGDHTREKTFLDFSVSNNAAGIVINTTGENDSLIARISHTIPVLAISRKITHHEYGGDFIDSDNYSGAYKLAEHLLANGHSKIAIINGNQELSTGVERFNGFMACLQVHDISLSDTFVYRGDFTQKSGYLAVESFLSLEEQPSAICAMNNSMAIGAIECLITHHIKVPEQVSLASYGDINNLPLLSIQPSYVSLNPIVIGQKSAELLLQRITERRTSNKEIIFDPALFVCSGVGVYATGVLGSK